MSEIDSLLQKAQEAVKSTNPIHAVIGSEACDLDSVSCCVALAHYLSTRSDNYCCVPLLNCHREDLSLRQDIIWLMQHLGIDHTSFLHYPEEFDSSNYKDLRVTIVDHNVPDEKLRPHVIEIIDHREDAEVVHCQRTIEMVGSCSSLVAERLLSDEDYEITKEIATLLIAAVVADTGNLVSEGRATDKDRLVVQKLQDKVDISISTDELYNKICTARHNTSDLTTLQLLRADFKQCFAGSFHVGFCTIQSLMTKLVTERTNIDQDMSLYCGQKNLQLLVLLCIQMKPLQKQIALYQPHNVSQDLVDSVAATLEVDQQLQVERVGEGTFDGIVFEQGNLAVTRKQIIPIVTKCLQQGDMDDSFGIGVVTPEPAVVAIETHEIKEEERTEATPKQTAASEEEEEDNRKEHVENEEDTQSQTEGSLLQLDSISAKLGESMDSFALAQDSDQGGQSPGSSRTSSTFNMIDRQEETRPPPPLEPIVDIVSPLDNISPPILPDDSSVPNIPEYAPEDELKETRDFRTVMIDGQERRINLKFIEQYRPIIQHGGYLGAEQTAVIVISSCYLPSKQLHNYPQLISQLFFYVLSVVDKLVVDDYVLVYLHSGAPRNSMPGIQWFHKFYRMIDRRLRKTLKHLYIVHPTFWVKTMLRLARPFISRKFYRKVHYISSLKQLSSFITVDELFIPNAVQSADQNLNPQDYKTIPPTSTT